MTPLWTAADAVRATGGGGAVDWAATGVSIDTRTPVPGDLFVALRGPNHDGHDFVGAALERGAAAAMVDCSAADMPAAAPLLRVGDTLAGLTALGRFARERSGARIVAVTGSVGKTGTKEALRIALGACGATFASPGSLNNHWGVPLSLARMPPDAAYGVFELGMNHPGEIAALTRLVRPHIAVVTTVAPAHLGFFRSVEEIADAKAEIFLGLEPGGVAVLNRDNPHYARLAAAAAEAGVGENHRLWRRSRGRPAPLRLRPGAARQHDRGLGRGQGRALSPECPRPALGDERARGTGRRGCRRLRPAASRRGAGRLRGAARARTPPSIAVARRHPDPDRRELQREPGGDARRTGGARHGQP